MANIIAQQTLIAAINEEADQPAELLAIRELDRKQRRKERQQQRRMAERIAKSMIQEASPPSDSEGSDDPDGDELTFPQVPTTDPETSDFALHGRIAELKD